MDAMSIATSGMQSAMRSFGASAANIVADFPPAPVQSGAAPIVSTVMTVPQADMSGDVVGALESVNSFRANLAVFRTGAAMFKSLLDTVA